MFKNMVRAGKSGMIYDFFMYGLSTVLVAKNVEPKNLLVEQLPKNQIIGYFWQLLFGFSITDESSFHGNTHGCNFQDK